MDWNVWIKEENQIEANELWCTAYQRLRKTVEEFPDEVQPCVRLIYITHDLLVENHAGGCGLGHEPLADFLLNYFHSALKRFENNAEFLFFAGIIMHIAEWYFGQSDNALALKLQKRALEKRPDDLLFRFSYQFAVRGTYDLELEILAHSILESEEYVAWAESWGYPGRYAIGQVKGAIGIPW